MTGPTPDKAMVGLPDRWLYCPKMGKIVEGLFLPIKTPLCGLYDAQIEPQHRFAPQDIFTAPLLKGKKIGLWVDLSKTDRFYDKSEVEKNDCLYRKIPMRGFGSSPTAEECSTFIRLVTEFRKEHPDEIVVVHCTHGHNRTGFVIVAYFCEMGFGAEAALRTFAAARKPGIYKQAYVDDIFARYDEPAAVVEAPPRPNWDENSLSMEENGEGAGTSNGSNDNSAVNKKKTAKLFADGKLPEVVPLDDEGLKSQLRKQVKDLVKFGREGFAGSQPVSMERSPSRDNLAFLAQRRYKLSWKADGARYLIYIVDKSQIYAFDRDNEVFPLPRLTFPHRKEERHVKNTLIDCELIFDHVNGREVPRFLIFDIIAYEGINLGKENFDTRLKCVKNELIGGRERAAAEGRLRKDKELCSVRAKDFWELNWTSHVLSEKFTRDVAHEIDGLIFQPVDEPYIGGRCDTVLKWKPPTHNSVDFKLQIRRVQKEGELPQHIGFLYVQHSTEPVDTMKATRSLLPYNNKIIECTRKDNEWVFMRERTDKSLPNSLKTARAVVNSMTYPIEKETLINFIEAKGYKGPPQKMRVPEQNGAGGGQEGGRQGGTQRNEGGSQKRRDAEASPRQGVEKKPRQTDEDHDEVL